MKKMLIATMMFYPFISNAASVGNIISQTKSIVITAPTTFSHILTPVSGITAGNTQGGLTLANGEVSAGTGSNPAQFAIQFASGGNNSSAAAGINAIITGSNPRNMMNLSLKADSSMSSTPITQTVGSTQWLVYPASTSFKYNVTTPDTTLFADTYPITINAAVYTP